MDTINAIDFNQHIAHPGWRSTPLIPWQHVL